MMSRGVILLALSLWMVACSAHDEYDYSLHPEALQQALNQCSKPSADTMECERLQKIALQVNKLAYQLRVSPQGYGKQILALQETIAEQQKAIELHGEQSDLQVSLNQNKQELQQRLAIVKWLESPES